MIIAGITGSIGHGKTTFANLLADQCNAARHFESWELVAEVASALKDEQPLHPAPDDLDAVNEWLFPLADIVSFHVHTSIEFNDIKLTDARLAKHPEHYEKLFEYLQTIQHQPSLATLPITADSKEAFRPLLQWLGGYLVARAGSGVWYDEIVRRIAHLRTSGCDIVTIGGVRYPGDAERLRNAGAVIIDIQRPELPIQDLLDITERERTLIEPDCLVVNNGTLADLNTCAAVVYEDLSLRQLGDKYTAKA
ncbi:hypothetical protein BH09PAT3_BH09PAT3_2570 [soil metagenome]